MRSRPPTPATMRARARRAVRGRLVLLAVAVAATLIVWGPDAPSRAQGPPPFPDFTTVFGRALMIDGGNLSPSEQPLIAFINGRSCGWSSTHIARAAEDVPLGDWGRTVYAIDARADGTGLYQLPGCGTAGDAISFYFPLIGRMAAREASFGSATGERADLSLDVHLRYRLRAPLMASDGATQ